MLDIKEFLKEHWCGRLAEEAAALDELREAKLKAGPETMESIKTQIAYHAGEKVAAQNALQALS